MAGLFVSFLGLSWRRSSDKGSVPSSGRLRHQSTAAQMEVGEFIGAGGSTTSSCSVPVDISQESSTLDII